MRRGPLMLIGLLGGLALLLASVAGCASAPDPVRQKQVAAAALQRDFPGFEIVRLSYYRHVPGLLGLEDSYQEHAQFTLRFVDAPKLLIMGDYNFVTSSGDPNAGLTGTIFHDQGVTPSQVRSFASFWTRHHPGLALFADGTTYVLSGAADGPTLQEALYLGGALKYDPARSRTWEAKRHMRLSDVFVFPTRTGAYWLHLDRESGTWTELGQDDWLVKDMGYKRLH